MRNGTVSLNLVIAVEVSILLLLVVVLLSLLPLLREQVTAPAAGNPGAVAAAPPAMRPGLRFDESAPPALSRLRSQRRVKGLRAVPEADPAMPSLAALRVKTEPRREIRSEARRAPAAPPARGADGPGAGFSI